MLPLSPTDTGILGISADTYVTGAKLSSETVLPLHGHRATSHHLQADQQHETDLVIRLGFLAESFARRSATYVATSVFLGLLYIFWTVPPLSGPLGTTSRPPDGVKEAYVTYLPPFTDPWMATQTQLLFFQSVLDPLTSDPSRDFVIMLTADSVSPEKRHELISQGARVILVEPIVDRSRPQEDKTKIHALSLMEYDRIIYLDPDFLLNAPLKDAWDEKAGDCRRGIASVVQTGESGEGEFDEGFWMARPSMVLHDQVIAAINGDDPNPQKVNRPR